MKSWRTTLAGWIGGLILILPEILDLLTGNYDDFSVSMVIAGIALIMGGTVARDNGVTSEKAGAK